MISKDGMDGVGRRTKREEMYVYICLMPGGSVVKNLPANAGDMSLIPGSGRAPRRGNGNPLHYFCLEKPLDSRV